MTTIITLTLRMAMQLRQWPEEQKDIGYKLEVNSGAYGAFAERYRNYGGATSDLQYVEYAVLAGNADADYYLAALGRSMNRFSTRFTENIYDASLSCTPQAVTSDVKSAKAEVTLTMKEDIAKFAKEMPEVEVTVQMSDPDSGEILDTQTKMSKNLQQVRVQRSALIWIP